MKFHKESLQDRKALLLKTIGSIIKEQRQNSGKGILLHAYEYDIPSSSLNLIERGMRDPQVTTLWKIANSYNMSFGELITEVEKHLPDKFSLIEDK